MNKKRSNPLAWVLGFLRTPNKYKTIDKSQWALSLFWRRRNAGTLLSIAVGFAFFTSVLDYSQIL
ncbi:MAG: hypothetical protein GY940_46635 [bacterium]|nr:hypothetical protein [bacterium]